jgi:hypothetical protein
MVCRLVDDALLDAVTKLCPRLEVLDVSWTDVTDRGLETFFAGPAVQTSLHSIVLQGITRFSNRALCSLARTVAGRLRRLDVFGCGLIQNLALRCVAECCPNLEDINLAHCIALGDAHMCALLVATARCLRVFACDGCRRVELAFAGPQLPPGSRFSASLTRLMLSQLPLLADVAVQDAAASCPYLTHVAVEECPLVGDGAFIALLGHCGKWKCCPSHLFRTVVAKIFVCVYVQVNLKSCFLAKQDLQMRDWYFCRSRLSCRCPCCAFYRSAAALACLG